MIPQRRKSVFSGMNPLASGKGTEFMGEKKENPNTVKVPFDAGIHILTPSPSSSEEFEKLSEFRNMLMNHSGNFYHKNLKACTDTQLVRFLVARKYNVNLAFDLFMVACDWRATRKPDEIEATDGWGDRMGLEAATGKTYVAGCDQYDRTILVFDNSVQNSSDIDEQIPFLAWTLQLAIRGMPPHCDKYLIFIHLEKFSLLNNPPIATVRETAKMLCDCFPERLGSPSLQHGQHFFATFTPTHISKIPYTSQTIFFYNIGHLIIYKPPWVFKAVFEVVKGLIDAKTVSKIIFLYGDDSDGSPNDLKMREIIGDNWKKLTGAGQPTVAPNSSPGYNHATFWPKIIERVQALQTKEAAEEGLTRSEKFGSPEMSESTSTKSNNSAKSMPNHRNQRSLSPLPPPIKKSTSYTVFSKILHSPFSSKGRKTMEGSVSGKSNQSDESEINSMSGKFQNTVLGSLSAPDDDSDDSFVSPRSASRYVIQ